MGLPYNEYRVTIRSIKSTELASSIKLSPRLDYLDTDSVKEKYLLHNYGKYAININDLVHHLYNNSDVITILTDTFTCREAIVYSIDAVKLYISILERAGYFTILSVEFLSDYDRVSVKNVLSKLNSTVFHNIQNGLSQIMRNGGVKLSIKDDIFILYVHLSSLSRSVPISATLNLIKLIGSLSAEEVNVVLGSRDCFTLDVVIYLIDNFSKLMMSGWGRDKISLALFFLYIWFSITGSDSMFMEYPGNGPTESMKLLIHENYLVIKPQELYGFIAALTPNGQHLYEILAQNIAKFDKVFKPIYTEIVQKRLAQKSAIKEDKKS